MHILSWVHIKQTWAKFFSINISEFCRFFIQLIHTTEISTNTVRKLRTELNHIHAKIYIEFENRRKIHANNAQFWIQSFWWLTFQKMFEHYVPFLILSISLSFSLLSSRLSTAEISFHVSLFIYFFSCIIDEYTL